MLTVIALRFVSGLAAALGQPVRAQGFKWLTGR